MPASRVSSSIVLYRNQPNQIETLLDSFQHSEEPVDVFFFDNSPTADLKGLLESAQSRYSRGSLHYHFNRGRNIGFGPAHNECLRKALSNPEGRYHAFINPDIRFPFDCLKNLRIFMETHPEIGLAAPKVLYPDGSPQPVCRLLPSPIDLFVRRFIPLRGIQESINSKNEMRDFDYSQVVDAPFLSGCFLFGRRETLEAVKGFDPRFFLYMEDVDLTRRVRRIARTVYYPGALAIHEAARESQRKLKPLLLHLKSAWAYFNKFGWVFDREREALNAATQNQESRKAAI